MRVFFVLCALLAIAVTSLARPKEADNVTDKTTTAIPQVTIPKNNSLNTTPSPVEESNGKLTSTTANTTPSELTTDNQKDHTKPDVIPIKKAETETSNVKKISTTAITPSEKTVIPTKPTVTTSSITSTTAIETISDAATTAIPATSVCPPTERHFDGLSFLGGIILTICLIGVGVFLCKYCQNIHEDKYRTL